MAKTEKVKERLITPLTKHELSADEVKADYRLAFKSRHASIIGRREVMTGKAKFGIFGDGKEVAQLAMAKAFKEGDWRSGYYRDQTFMLASGMMTMAEFFGQLYADTDLENDPFSGGRQMGSHFATRLLDEDGNWLPQTSMKITAADLSPTGAQMAKLIGLAYASKLYRGNVALREVAGDFSANGDEVAFGTIGNASTSEGIFWETINAAGVLRVPMAVSVWDDGYGISVPNEMQTTKSSISTVLRGFQTDENGPGYEIYVVPGWDYVALIDAYIEGIEKCRRDHIPVLFHITEMTQPLGHSTSGSHERYKSKDRLEWETENDCLVKMKNWMVAEEIVSEEEISEWEAADRKEVNAEQKAAFDRYLAPILREQQEALKIVEGGVDAAGSGVLDDIIAELKDPPEINRKVIHSSMVHALFALRDADAETKRELAEYLKEYDEKNRHRYQSFLYSESPKNPIHVEEKKATYSEKSEVVDGRLVLNRCFDNHFKKDARLFVLGEDVGTIGDVNLALEGLQEKYGELRVTDTGIREGTILGQAIGAAMRGLRPIAEIQYLDYLLYALQLMSDDLATLHYRTAGGQKAPVIIRTRGHRFQGIWHTGSPMGMILHSCRGIYLCVPRNMTQAAGLYNTLMQGDSPALLIEVLGGYRTKERVPDNVGSFTVPLGVPEVLREGSDVTVVTYGASCRIAMEAAEKLEDLDIGIEVIDVQTLNPFDRNASIARSLEKTNAVLFLDEDVPGGASAFMMQEVLERQQGWQWLDTAPKTLAASESRSAYAVDGDHFTKPSREDVMKAVYEIMSERDPAGFPPV
jgi:2-oxoisovalerate dehydrogenase E1 component